MKMNKKFRIICIIAVVTIFSGIIYYTYAYNTVKEINVQCSYMRYPTIDKLESNAELILIGSVLDKFEDREHITTKFDDGNIQDFYTKTKFTIKSIIKMPEKLSLTENSIFDIIEPVGLIQEVDGKKMLKLEGYEPLKENEIYIKYLKDNGSGGYGIINMNDGRFNLKTDENEHPNTLKAQSTKLKSDVVNKYKNMVQ